MAILASLAPRCFQSLYSNVDSKPMPFDSNPRVAWNICLQRTCTRFHKQCLWKCPALAYHAIMSLKLRLDSEPVWQLFRDYQACPPTASDDQVREFLAVEEVRQCGLCPAKAFAFRHRDSTAR